MNDETQTTGQDVPVTDTTDTQTSEATVQTNNEAPEAATETKESEVNATDTVEDKLYAGKYKSVEDLEKSYQELQSKFGKETSEKAELTRILNEAFATPDTTDTVTDTFDEPNTEIEQIKMDNAVIKFAMNHQDADGAAMKDILANDPMIKQISGHDAKLEYAFLRSQSMSQPKAIAEAKKTAQVEAQQKTVEKQVAQVESARKSEAVDENSDSYNRATGNYDQETRDQARKDWIRKNLVNL